MKTAEADHLLRLDQMDRARRRLQRKGDPMKLNFTDGVSFDLDGDFRVETRFDGLYVVGRGMLCPVRNRAEADDLIDQLKQTERRGDDHRQQTRRPDHD